MNTIIIKTWNEWLNSRPKLKQWIWFIALWLGGLASVVILTYPLKLLIKLAQ